MCRIEGQKAMKYVLFAVNVCMCEMLFLTCTEHTSTISHGLMKLRIMTISNKTKVLSKFGTSKMMFVELMAKSYETCTVCQMCTYVKCSSSHAQNTLQPCHLLVKLRIMTISLNPKVLVKFGTSEMICVELRAKKL